MILFFAILAAFIGAPSGALAEPISSAIAIALAASSAGAGTFAAIAAGFGALGAFATRIIVGAGLSLLSQAFAKKPKVNGQGIQTEQTTTGDVTAAKFVVGTYAVEGHAVAPAYSRFKNNGILTYILEVSNVPVTGLTGRIVINGKYSDIEAPADSSGPFNEVFTGSGRRILTAFRQDDTDPTAWLWFYDGTQTNAAEPLVRYYEHHVDRPWTTDHVLHGTAYAVLEFALDPEIYQGLPSVRFEVKGIKLYDPRKDTTVGGSGPHRWDDPTTWEWTDNPQVINYNILRGITVPTGDIWGGRVDAEDLPLDNWFAAMNECDVLVGDRKQYVAGFEINVEEMEPVDVIEEMNRASFAQMSEFGGVFRVRVGAPAAPVLHVTDADFVITEGSVLTPFPAFDTVTNGITGTYVEPNDIWEGRDADLILNEDWVAEDGRQRVSSLGLPAVSVKAQAQQLLNAYLQDGRRFRTHQMTLPPSFALVEPLDSISFTSEAFGYTSKVFEVIEVEDRTDTLLQVVTVREREAGDVAIKPELEVAAPLPTNGQTPPAPLVVPLSVAAFDLSDGAGNARRPAILLTWMIESLPAIRNLKYQVRVKATQEIVAEGTASVSDARKLVPLDTHLANTEMEAQARYVADAPTAWTPWLSVTTPDLRLTQSDLSDALRDQFDAAFAVTQARLGEDGIPPSVADLLNRIEQVIAPIGPDDIPGTPHVERLDGSLLAEAQARAADALAVAGGIRAARERIKSAAQLALEATARDFLARDEVRTTLVAEVEGARAEAAAALTVVADGQLQIAQSVQTLETTTADIAALAQTIDQARIDGDGALANQIALLSVGTVTQFDHAVIWHWDTTVEGWTGVSNAPTVTADGWLAPATGSGAVSPAGLAIPTQTYRQLRARLRRSGAPAWAAQFWWAAGGQSFDATRRVTVGEPEWADDVALLTVDLAWSGIVDRVRLDLPAGVEIDWLAVGRPAPGASSADLAAERSARISQGLAQADAIEALGAELADLDGRATGTAEALDATTARVTDTETGLSTLTDATTALSGRVDDAETGIGLIGDAVDTLTLRTEQLEGGERVQSNSTRAVRSRIKLAGDRAAQLAARSILGNIAAQDLLSRASQDLNSKIELTDDQIKIVAEAVTLVQSAIPGLATADALQVLATEVTNVGGAVTALATRTSTVESALNTPETGVLARVSTVEATRVTEAEAVGAINQIVSVKYGDLAAMAEATAFAEATANGISAGHVVRLNGANVFEVVSVADGIEEGATVTGRWLGNYLRLDGNVEVTGDFLATKIFAQDVIVERLTVTEEVIGLDAVGKISNTRRSINTGGLGTAYSTVLTHVASHKSRASERHMILFCRMQIEGSSAAAGNVLEYRILRDGVLMSGVPPLKRDVRPGEVASEFFGIKQRTTVGSTSTTYTLEARVAANGAGISAVTINTGTEIWTEEKSIAEMT